MGRPPGAIEQHIAGLMDEIMWVRHPLFRSIPTYVPGDESYGGDWALQAVITKARKIQHTLDEKSFFSRMTLHFDKAVAAQNAA